ncbi:glycoside hydrolase family 2 protein [Hymenobacter volaticus]|uniref:beta-galactosidase n=1 Tax=Hymenobacter volaticus TaxID=2932254 RepID=A0ABY4GE26_9BACT|nr:glycoside hydrolase family 2 TIM barrel-domain containing protein [Hymenobacter volaticus]UOQ69108.1 glycoside hydrolase family 2 [Hymenobacter volaticus]
MIERAVVRSYQLSDVKTFSIRQTLSLLLFFLGAACAPAIGQLTQVQYLSGHGKDDPVKWDFMCTRGRNSGKWTKIGVPSNWETQGFGTFNYGFGKEDPKEAGLYRRTFSVPAAWKQKRIFLVFDGSMTDTEVKINGQLAGPIHHGSFYRFRYDITPLLKVGQKNKLEVTVHKVSANATVNEAERTADFWIFGGIFRPVFLEAYPEEHLERLALDAKADGSFKLNAYLAGVKTATTVQAQVKTQAGKLVGTPLTAIIPAGSALVQLQGQFVNPALWSPEFPNLYRVEVTLKSGPSTLHTITETFGFRTVELRPRDGFYVNGQRIMFKGVNRGSYWPTSGRTTSRRISELDANLIKDMNMNAVRMSHYPPDEHFLQVCDSLGLFVIDELTGWQYPPYDTEVGRKLVRELVLRDVNHPSIVLWANGNEGGFNYELLPDYPKYDPQNRPVIHPWINSNGMNTTHYIGYNYGLNTFFNGADVFFPTEFLHGLYDGGHGAGLDDFWNLMRSRPTAAGGFLWDFCDQAVVRVDQKGELDTKGNSAADGILGPYREKEASFFTIKEIWAPIFFPERHLTPQFDGKLAVENRYHYTNLSHCKFSWKLKKFRSLNHADTTILTGTAPAPNLLPQTSGMLTLPLPPGWDSYDVLYLTAHDLYGREIYTWSWPISRPEEVASRLVTKGAGPVAAREDAGQLVLMASGVEVTLDKKTGLLKSVRNAKKAISLTNGPVLLDSDAQFQGLRHADTLGTHVVEARYSGKDRLQVKWTMYPSGWLELRYQYQQGGPRELLGITFAYPEAQVTGMQLLADGPYRVWKNRLKGTTLNSWDKAYNNTVTGETWVYPEFKGYYANFYGARVRTREADFTVLSGSENLYLHMLNPAVPKFATQTNSVAPFPAAGGISFLHGISAIGTKGQKAVDLGPMSQLNLTTANGHTDSQQGVLYFDFR